MLMFGSENPLVMLERGHRTHVELWWIEEDEDQYLWIKRFPSSELSMEPYDRLWKLYDEMSAELGEEICTRINVVDGAFFYECAVLLMPTMQALEKHIETVARPFDI